jgi:hypothetical protein
MSNETSTIHGFNDIEIHVSAIGSVCLSQINFHDQVGEELENHIDFPIANLRQVLSEIAIRIKEYEAENPK